VIASFSFTCLLFNKDANVACAAVALKRKMAGIIAASCGSLAAFVKGSRGLLIYLSKPNSIAIFARNMPKNMKIISRAYKVR
jgi:hypothetical protein